MHRLPSTAWRPIGLHGSRRHWGWPGMGGSRERLPVTERGCSHPPLPLTALPGPNVQGATSTSPRACLANCHQPCPVKLFHTSSLALKHFASLLCQHTSFFPLSFYTVKAIQPKKRSTLLLRQHPQSLATISNAGSAPPSWARLFLFHSHIKPQEGLVSHFFALTQNGRWRSRSSLSRASRRRAPVATLAALYGLGRRGCRKRRRPGGPIQSGSVRVCCCAPRAGTAGWGAAGLGGAGEGTLEKGRWGGLRRSPPAGSVRGKMWRGARGAGPASRSPCGEPRCTAPQGAVGCPP